MMHIHWRLGELWTIQQKKELSEMELEEMRLCLQHNATYARKLAELYNLSTVAHMTNDWDWMHSISADIDKLEIEYKLKKPTLRER